MTLALTVNETLNGSHRCPSECRCHSGDDRVAIGGDRYMISPTSSPTSIPPPIPPPPPAPLLPVLMVSVDVKHHVYFGVLLAEWTDSSRYVLGGSL